MTADRFKGEREFPEPAGDYGHVIRTNIKLGRFDNGPLSRLPRQYLRFLVWSGNDGIRMSRVARRRGKILSYLETDGFDSTSLVSWLNVLSGAKPITYRHRILRRPGPALITEMRLTLLEAGL